MEATTLAAALPNKAERAKVEEEPLKAQLEGVKAQLQNLRIEAGGWRKAAQSACAKGLEYAQRAKKMEVLAVVQSYLAKRVNGAPQGGIAGV